MNVPEVMAQNEQVKPKVAILMGTFNGQEHLGQQLDSIAAQTHATGNSGSEANLMAVIVLTVYKNFVRGRFDDQVDLDSDNWPRSSKPCGIVTQRRVKVHRFLHVNFAVKP